MDVQWMLCQLLDQEWKLCQLLINGCCLFK
jgi:hypothetical protein